MTVEAPQLSDEIRALEGKDSFRDCYEVAEAVATDERAISELRAADVDPAKLERSVLLTINTAGQDSYRSKIPPKGLDFKGRFRANPVVLWAHDSKQPPIARALATYVDESKSIARTRSVAEFAPADLNPMAETAYRMLKDGWIRGVSIGFRTIKVEPDPEDPQGYIVARSELLEYSILPIPSNPGALKEARAAGINTDPILAEAMRVLDGEAIRGWVRENAEEVWRMLEGPRIRSITPADIVTPTPIVEASVSTSFDPAPTYASVAQAFRDAKALLRAGQKDKQ